MAASSQSQFPLDLMLCRTSVSLQEETVALEDVSHCRARSGIENCCVVWHIYGFLFSLKGLNVNKVFIKNIKAVSNVKFSHASRSSI